MTQVIDDAHDDEMEGPDTDYDADIDGYSGSSSSCITAIVVATIVVGIIGTIGVVGGIGVIVPSGDSTKSTIASGNGSSRCSRGGDSRCGNSDGELARTRGVPSLIEGVDGGGCP